MKLDDTRKGCVQGGVGFVRFRRSRHKQTRYEPRLINSRAKPMTNTATDQTKRFSIY